MVSPTKGLSKSNQIYLLGYIWGNFIVPFAVVIVADEIDLSQLFVGDAAPLVIDFDGHVTESIA
ncbi:MAG: hypothetical protein MJE77_44200 [Proteobacteria bacterium]|nr:hypothetical protein [Pseudomonadota bacterium]